jgi:hypothetical protein
MSTGSTILTKEIFGTGKWDTLYVRQPGSALAKSKGAGLCISGGSLVKTPLLARLVKAWPTRYSAGSKEMEFRDNCESVDRLAPAPWIRRPPAKRCQGCPRSRIAGGDAMGCAPTITIGLWLYEQEKFCILKGIKSARKGVNRLIATLLTGGAIDLLRYEVKTEVEMVEEKNGSIIFLSPLFRIFAPEEALEDAEKMEEVSAYELVAAGADEEEEKAF